jgi:hypothetical protein
MTRGILITLLLSGLVCACLGAGKKYKLYLVTFHLEASKTDNPKMVTPVKLGSDHRQYFFDKIPSFTDHDIRWFYPFSADDGVSYGAAFKFKDHSTTELKAITLTNQGKLLGLRCSDAPLQAVLIDRPISDGIVVVWNGLQQKHLQEFRKRFPHVDDLAPPSGPTFSLPGRE